MLVCFLHEFRCMPAFGGVAASILPPCPYVGLPKSGLGPVLTPTAQDRTTSGPDIWVNVKDQTGPASGPNYRSSPGLGPVRDSDWTKTKTRPIRLLTLIRPLSKRGFKKW